VLAENDLVVSILTFMLDGGAIVLSVMWWVYAGDRDRRKGRVASLAGARS
jgi:hypothetical protein